MGIKSVVPQDATTGGDMFAAPQSRVSAPEIVDWHMILDAELDQISRPETGIIGSLGFLALGAFLNNSPTIMSVWFGSPRTLSIGDVTTLEIGIGSLVASVICLSIFALSVYRNWGTANRIRNRPKMFFGAAPNADLPAREKEI